MLIREYVILADPREKAARIERTHLLSMILEGIARIHSKERPNAEDEHILLKHRILGLYLCYSLSCYPLFKSVEELVLSDGPGLD